MSLFHLRTESQMLAAISQRFESPDQKILSQVTPTAKVLLGRQGNL